MNSSGIFSEIIFMIKKIIVAIVVIGTLIGVGYGALWIYNAAVEDAARRIRQEVALGVGEGIHNTINPFKWIGNALGGKRTKRIKASPIVQ